MASHRLLFFFSTFLLALPTSLFSTPHPFSLTHPIPFSRPHRRFLIDSIPNQNGSSRLERYAQAFFRVSSFPRSNKKEREIGQLRENRGCPCFPESETESNLLGLVSFDNCQISLFLQLLLSYARSIFLVTKLLQGNERTVVLPSYIQLH